jgi:antitoxin component HigA of HigAB toxin-antitoxin module
MRTTKSLDTTDRYLDLVRRFPLRRLKSQQQHAEALKVLGRVSLAHQGARDSGVLDYLDVLAGLIDQYERAAQLKVDASQTSPAGVVRHLINANGLSVSGLAREIGIGQSNLSEMLSGRREFSKRAIAGIRDRFGLSPEIFF